MINLVKNRWCFLIFSWSLLLAACQPEKPPPRVSYDVVVVGAGTGATTAAIQSARSEARTLLVNPLPWLGGMLTAAGVSATDGNHRLPAGMWGEFRQALRDYYGGADSLFTGWVSNTMFEPKVGNRIWKDMADSLSSLDIWYESTLLDIRPLADTAWELQIRYAGSILSVQAHILVDGTDLGDVAAQAGVSYDLGMDARSVTGEAMAPEQANDIVQDLTYVAILQDFGDGTDHTIPRPPAYDPAEFACACQENCENKKAHPCQTMLNYGKLPNGKYMINWPIEGNDYYANVVEQDSAARALAFAEAKNQTLRFVYYMQHELGYTHLGLAEDEFPTSDGLALLPYHREGRRIHGMVRLNVNHILRPYDYSLYRTGIAVGDYPIDHHHDKYEGAPDIDFPMVPSYSIPLGALIPAGVDRFLVADKAISVTNIVNGTTRLQPVVIQIGQVAGLVAAMAAQQGVTPAALDIRAVQARLLAENGYLLPFIDIEPTHPHFAAVQRIGATGLLRARPVPYQWANQSWFDPDSTVRTQPLLTDLQQWMNLPERTEQAETVSIAMALAYVVQHLNRTMFGDQLTQTSVPDMMPTIKDRWENVWQFPDFRSERPITRLELAVLLDYYLHPFDFVSVDMFGEKAE